MGNKKRRKAFQAWEEALDGQRAGARAGAGAPAREAQRGAIERGEQRRATAEVEASTQTPNSGATDPDAIETLPHDVHLLERSRTQWQFGEWRSLAALDEAALQHHPDRAKLALFAATGLAQRGNLLEARQLTQKAIEWGVDRELVKRLLLSGMHNSLARAAALAGQDERVRRHFEDALNVGLPGAAAPMAIRARAENELTQIGLEQALPQLIAAPQRPDAPSYVKQHPLPAPSTLDLLVFLPDRRQQLIRLYADRANLVEAIEDRLLFEVPEGLDLFLHSNTAGRLATPPPRDSFGLSPSTDYRVTGHLACSNRDLMIHLIEYDSSDRLAEHSERAVDNRFDLRIRTARRHARLCVAFRIAGRGELDLGISVLRLQRLAAETAPASDRPA